MADKYSEECERLWAQYRKALGDHLLVRHRLALEAFSPTSAGAPEGSHPSIQEMLLACDGEVSTRDAARVRSHISSCWRCWGRMAGIVARVAEFTKVSPIADDTQTTNLHFDKFVAGAAG
jgi:hypothetical protein